MPKKSHKRQRRPLFAPAWTVGALADVLNIDPKVVYAARRAGELGPFFKIGMQSFVTTEDVIRWIKSHKRG
jgi:hypothetical protein